MGGLGSIVGAVLKFAVLIRGVQGLITSLGPDLVERIPSLSSDLIFASRRVPPVSSSRCSCCSSPRV